MPINNSINNSPINNTSKKEEEENQQNQFSSFIFFFKKKREFHIIHFCLYSIVCALLTRIRKTNPLQHITYISSF